MDGQTKNDMPEQHGRLAWVGVLVADILIAASVVLGIYGFNFWIESRKINNDNPQTQQERVQKREERTTTLSEPERMDYRTAARKASMRIMSRNGNMKPAAPQILRIK